MAAFNSLPISQLGQELHLSDGAHFARVDAVDRGQQALVLYRVNRLNSWAGVLFPTSEWMFMRGVPNPIVQPLKPDVRLPKDQGGLQYGQISEEDHAKLYPELLTWRAEVATAPVRPDEEAIRAP